MSRTPDNAEPLQTGKFQNPFQNDSESANRDDPKPAMGKLFFSSAPTDIAIEFRNMAAIGGAVGAMVLGSWSIIGAMMTSWSSINAMIAIALGLYGLRSKRKRMALMGIVLAVAGLVLSLLTVNVNL